MKCPVCGAHGNDVRDSRPTNAGNNTRRRRHCRACGNRFTTVEIVVDEDTGRLLTEGWTLPPLEPQMAKKLELIVALANTLLSRRYPSPTGAPPAERGNGHNPEVPA